MPEMSVHSSETIDASASTVMAALEDFRTWPVWSPWLYTEPDATVTYEGEAGKPGHGYQWQGNKVGAGSMSLQSRDERNLHLDLEFLKPFKSQADVSFALDSPTPESTTVTWTMDSKLPFFMFFYKATMVGMIRSDYRRGLMMLKDYLEHGEVLSNVKIEAIADCPAS
nr:SRPBCC family protein [Granulosicoccus sp.]